MSNFDTRGAGYSTEQGGFGGYETATRGRTGTATIFGQVMFLVGVAIAFAALGAYIARSIAPGTAQIIGFVGIGMLFAQSFVRVLRTGAVGIGWMMALALALGISIGPFVNAVAQVNQDAVIKAAGGTALITLIMASAGLATSKDLVRWMRPLSFIMLGLFVISLGMLLFGIAGSPVFSIIVIAVSAALLVVDFNFVRRHAGEDDVVWIATGIFVSVLNIFISLLNIFSSD